MTGVIERHRQWFCSERCIAEYERRQAAPAAAHTPACHRPGRPLLLLDPWVWVPLSGLFLATLGSWWSWAAAVSATYVEYLHKVLIPALLGLWLGGVIDHFIPKAYIIKLLSGSRKRVIVRATVLGFLASTCSHGTLALTIELYRKGASIPAVVSFLLASPWASMALTLILLSLFGVKGILVIAGALGIAFVVGLVFQRLAERGLLGENLNTAEIEEGFSIRRDLAERWRRYSWSASQMLADGRGVLAGMVPLGRMVLGWVQLGLILSAVLGTFLPHQAIMRFFGPSFGGLAATLGAAAVIEVCSEGTAPVAFELYRHTGAFGNAFAFLMGGVITDYTELAAIWRNVGRRTVLWLLVVTLPLVFGLGLLLNWLRV